jgi:hypothetical protein
MDATVAGTARRQIMVQFSLCYLAERVPGVTDQAVLYWTGLNGVVG